jgi:hypothetical protein
LKRARTILVLIALAPLLMGGGGPDPGGVPAAAVFIGPKVKAIIVMDPHQDMVTENAKHASIYLKYKRWFHPELNAGAVVRIPDNFQMVLGCDVTKTELRFVNTPARANSLSQWLTSSQGDILSTLFNALGITIPPGVKPVITEIKKQGCTTGPGIETPSGTAPGMLWMEVVIRLQAPSPPAP